MSPSGPTAPGTRLPSLSNTPGASALRIAATVKGSLGLRSETLARRLEGIIDPRCSRAALAWAGTIVATATPAAAKPAPPKNRRRPASTIFSQWAHGLSSPGTRRYAYRRGFLRIRPVRLPAGRLVQKSLQAAHEAPTTCRDVSTYSIIEKSFWLVTQGRVKKENSNCGIAGTNAMRKTMLAVASHAGPISSETGASLPKHMRFLRFLPWRSQTRLAIFRR